MHLRLIAALVIGCLYGEFAIGQSENRYRNNVILKIMPLSNFDPDNTLQGGIEIPLPGNKFTVQQEAGWGHSHFNMWYIAKEPRVDKKTFRLRSQVRFYYFQKPWTRGYLAGEYLFKRVINKEKPRPDQCQSGNCDTSVEKVDFGRFVNAFHVKVGWQFYSSSRISFDIYTGIGIREASVRSITPGYVGGPKDDYRWLDPKWFSKDRVTPSLSSGFSIGIILGKMPE